MLAGTMGTGKRCIDLTLLKAKSCNSCASYKELKGHRGKDHCKGKNRELKRNVKESGRNKMKNQRKRSTYWFSRLELLREAPLYKAEGGPPLLKMKQ